MKVIIGDIGGTKTLLSLLELNNNGDYKILKQTKYASVNYNNFQSMIKDFLEEDSAEEGCFAIAGPVINNSCDLTNLNWYLEADTLADELGIKKITLLNDFAAVSYGILTLKNNEICTLQEGEKNYDSTIAVVGAGTGLGESFLVNHDRKYKVISTEGGHTDFSAKNELEWQLVNYLKQKNKWDRVSVERVVSGQGIVSIYQFLRDINFAEESPDISQKIKQWESGDNSIDVGEIIGLSAIKKDNILTTKTMSIFIENYASEIGNFALKILPYSGIYIAGGIATKITSLLQENHFIDIFLAKGRMKKLLEKMPLYIVENPEVGLKGCIYYLLKR
ncbi:glucokinase [Geminocystis sp. NIES-3708]|uniref:glucokinase n=1 Tax=Geminocystis sp. NIES-3708 TaxID=1615909 RepID=UPI0005FC87D0|nr:glucokinase [Geminocystis sp. NIES-3708]BAQ62597.1 glucokinase [Geminocystis sp. NIES-3708]